MPLEPTPLSQTSDAEEIKNVAQSVQRSSDFDSEAEEVPVPSPSEMDCEYGRWSPFNPLQLPPHNCCCSSACSILKSHDLFCVWCVFAHRAPVSARPSASPSPSRPHPTLRALGSPGRSWPRACVEGWC